MPLLFIYSINKENLSNSRSHARCEHINCINEITRCVYVLQTQFPSITVWHWPSAFTVLACVWYRVIIGPEQRQIKQHQAILLICKSTSFGYQRLATLCTFCLLINTLMGLQLRMRFTVHPNGEGKIRPITTSIYFKDICSCSLNLFWCMQFQKILTFLTSATDNILWGEKIPGSLLQLKQRLRRPAHILQPL